MGTLAAAFPLALVAECRYRRADVFSIRARLTSLVIAVVLAEGSGRALAGAWGGGSFDNDDALDWGAACVRSKSTSAVRDALERALRGKYLQAPEGSRAVAAAEVVAAAKGRPNPELPRDLAAWVKGQPAQALSILAPLAIKALARVRDPKTSELRGLWDDGKPAKWLEAIADLESRVR
jgi:hypothetical protein